MIRHAWHFACVLSLAFGSSTAAWGGVTLEDRLEPLIESHQGKVAVAVVHLETGESFRRDADEPMPTASLIKFPVMIEAYRQAEAGDVDLDGTITLEEDDKVPGSGVLTQHFSDGATFPLRDAVRLMIAFSDNTATNLVLDAIGLPSTAETMVAMGYPETKIHSKVYRRDTSVFPERSPRYGLGSTTADDMVDLLGKLHRKELVSASASEAMYKHLINCQDESMFKRGLPEGTRFAHKTGYVADVRTSAGIIETSGGPVAVCVLTSENEDTRYADDNAALRLIGEVAREVYNHFTRLPDDEERDEAEGPPAFRIGDTGDAVESLQRRLNARLEPSPGLAVDGDFGPGTEAALIRFQEENDLPANGIADSETMEALGPESEGKPPVPSPDEVNNRAAPKEPADSLEGPPLVTAEGWVILDAETGEVVAGGDEDQPLDMASTTKIMTAAVVLGLAEADPEVLDEVVTFTPRADGTVGSTSGVKAGERVKVGELLYGLLLPSGNDASVALAEHFGARLGAPGDAPDEIDPLARFVAAMNREAEDLGLSESRFANPHGLTAPGHHASALDLARLARHLLDDDRFAAIVSTSEHACTLYNLVNEGRNVVWTNTNRLLPIEGYEGVKTGTTNAAGACLVALGHRGDTALIVVVLGSDSSDARYVDARNLFRWAWSTVAASSESSAAAPSASSGTR